MPENIVGLDKYECLSEYPETNYRCSTRTPVNTELL